VLGASLLTEPVLVDDIGRLFLGALVIVGLAAVHRLVAAGRMNSGWLWATYAMLVLVAPFAVAGLAGWGFVDNWARSWRRSGTPA
jgi:hypothetical protein